jgi:hypothetical protein
MNAFSSGWINSNPALTSLISFIFPVGALPASCNCRRYLTKKSVRPYRSESSFSMLPSLQMAFRRATFLGLRVQGPGGLAYQDLLLLNEVTVPLVVTHRSALTVNNLDGRLAHGAEFVLSDRGPLPICRDQRHRLPPARAVIHYPVTFSRRSRKGEWDPLMNRQLGLGRDDHKLLKRHDANGGCVLLGTRPHRITGKAE